jgi:hypothetical protein
MAISTNMFGEVTYGSFHKSFHKSYHPMNFSINKFLKYYYAWKERGQMMNEFHPFHEKGIMMKHILSVMDLK